VFYLDKLFRNLIIAVLSLFPFITLIIIEFMQGNILTALIPSVLNYLIIATPGIILFWAFNSLKLALILPTSFYILFGIINHYVIAFRNASFQPWDILASKTVLNVLPAIELSLDISVLLAISWVIAVFIISFIIKKTPKIKTRILPFLICCSLLIVSGALIFKNDSRDDFWDTVSASRKNGFLLNFISSIQILNNPEPENYNINELELLLRDFENKIAPDDYPNIIVIMNEAFSDLGSFTDLKTNRDPLEFFHSLNATKGNVVVSVFGGGTCNTEYDFLTGNSSFMLRPGSYPMQQFVSTESPSLASILKIQGYQTTAIHPYYPNGWNRNRAYSFLGFDKFISLNDFETPEIMRQFVSDRCTYEKIIEITESAQSPQFIFCVTMQNHLGYDISYENFDESISISGKTLPQTKQYLSLISESDSAIKELIKHYKKQEKTTYILFFGDHQPALGDGFYESLTPTSPLDRYTVPFFLWCNNKTITLDSSVLSANFLAPILLDTIGLKTTPYYNFLLHLSERLPVISAQGILTSGGNLFTYGTENDYSDLLNLYNSLQYNQVFDRSKRIDKLFIP